MELDRFGFTPEYNAEALYKCVVTARDELHREWDRVVRYNSPFEREIDCRLFIEFDAALTHLRIAFKIIALELENYRKAKKEDTQND